MRGKFFSRHIACRRPPFFGEVLFSGEKYPKAARGQQAQIGFDKPYAPVSPWYPLSEMRLAAVLFIGHRT